ncbi:endolysin [Corticibacter populi]|uniref:Lysozyme n=1 Tax=Corticibacter populi TaxID=1550736 RepID=A0A3M6QZZ6_9BURK|nr:glycoside hydrolase family protein [Corticibacter populi]RMX08483.1 endolysin [Corticibacter populi]RZS35796.1 lysozyme [Corticibacter populi]
MTSKVPAWLATRLAALVVAVGITGGGTYWASKTTDEAMRDQYVTAVAADTSTSLAVKLAMVMGRYYESSGEHYGRPYVDTNGKGRPLTVCNGVTGAGVVSGRYYSPADCYRLEKARYLRVEAFAQSRLIYWPTYDPFVQATFIDFIWNKGEGNFSASTMLRKANAGDLVGACRENPRWNRGTVNGVSTVLPGLVVRGEANGEMCADWRIDP